MNDQAEQKSIPILMYHCISRQASQQYRSFAVPPELFAEQMAYLHEHGYTALTVSQFINTRIAGNAILPERAVIITFDDGFADFFTDALPVLLQYGLVATLYIPTAFLNSTSRWLWREGEGMRRMLTWEQLGEISARGIECGGHSHSHPQLDTLPRSVARDEIVRCKQLLEDRLGQPILSFAYPYGYHNSTTKQLVRDAGYTSACAVRYEMCARAADPFALSRLLVTAETRTHALRTLLTTPLPSVGTALYKQIRVPLWRFVRRCSLSARLYAQADVKAG